MLSPHSAHRTLAGYQDHAYGWVTHDTRLHSERKVWRSVVAGGRYVKLGGYSERNRDNFTGLRRGKARNVDLQLSAHPVTHAQHYQSVAVVREELIEGVQRIAHSDEWIFEWIEQVSQVYASRNAHEYVQPYPAFCAHRWFDRHDEAARNLGVGQALSEMVGNHRLVD